MNTLEKLAPLAARILIASSFVLGGITKVLMPDAMTAYMQSVGLPSVLLYPSAFMEIVGSLALILGFQARWAGLVLAGFSVVATLFFHNNLADQTTQLLFFKNLAMIGALLYVFAFGAGSFALDNRQAFRPRSA